MVPTRGGSAGGSFAELIAPPFSNKTNPMIIGIPKEIKQQENRVGLLPSAAYQLIKRGHRVLVTAGAGVGSGYPDEEYRAAGAEVLAGNADVFEQAGMIVKVKEPLPTEFAMIKPGQILFTSTVS